jgi:hypothetical protein
MSLNLLNCHTRASARPALFLDIEGDVDAASYYLIGVLTVANGKATQKSFWAKHCDEEEIIWRRFLRGGLGNQDTAISGNSAPTDRARCPGKQKDHEQKHESQPVNAPLTFCFQRSAIETGAVEFLA